MESPPARPPKGDSLADAHCDQPGEVNTSDWQQSTGASSPSRRDLARASCCQSGDAPMGAGAREPLLGKPMGIGKLPIPHCPVAPTGAFPDWLQSSGARKPLLWHWRGEGSPANAQCTSSSVRRETDQPGWQQSTLAEDAPPPDHSKGRMPAIAFCNQPGWSVPHLGDSGYTI